MAVDWACDGARVTVPPATVDATPAGVLGAAVVLIAPMDDMGAGFVDAWGVEFTAGLVVGFTDMLLLAHCTPKSERIQHEPKRLHIEHISCVFSKLWTE